LVIDTGNWCTSQSFCGSDYSFIEYINTATGYAFPETDNGSQEYIINGNGKVLGSIIGGVQPLGPLVVGGYQTIQMYEAFFSKCGYYVPQARGWSLTFVKQSDSSVYSCRTQFKYDQYHHELDENQSGGDMKAFISLGLTAASIVLSLLSDGTYTLIAAALGLAAWEVSSDTCTLTSGITLEQNEVSCKESGGYFTCGGNAKACGMGTAEKPYDYFGEDVGIVFCAPQGYPANTTLRNPYCTITKYNFTEQFMVFNKTRSCNPTLYSGSVSSSAYIQAADE